MSINGIYAIETRIREIESKINVVVGESSKSKAFSDVLKSSMSDNLDNSSISEIDGIINRVSQKIGIDEELVKLDAKAESGK